jgi:hypothetical protein
MYVYTSCCLTERLSIFFQTNKYWIQPKRSPSPEGLILTFCPAYSVMVLPCSSTFDEATWSWSPHRALVPPIWLTKVGVGFCCTIICVSPYGRQQPCSPESNCSQKLRPKLIQQTLPDAAQLGRKKGCAFPELRHPSELRLGTGAPEQWLPDATRTVDLGSSSCRLMLPFT